MKKFQKEGKTGKDLIWLLEKNLVDYIVLKKKE